MLVNPNIPQWFFVWKKKNIFERNYLISFKPNTCKKIQKFLIFEIQIK